VFGTASNTFHTREQPERFVDAFTRACGLGEDDVREWLETRRRIAVAEPSPSDEPPASPCWRRLVPLAVAAQMPCSIVQPRGLAT
jgi:hypothetical protein